MKYRWKDEGFRVYFCAPSSETERGKTIENELGDSVHFIPRDVTKADQVREMFGKVRDTAGRLDVLFNNAGIAESVGRIHEIPIDDVQRIFDINQLGSWLVLK